MTPYELKFLLHLRTVPTSWPLKNTEHYKSVVNNLEAEGVIRANAGVDTGWELTPLGDAWLEVILHVPKPKPCFVDYSGKVVSTAF